MNRPIVSSAEGVYHPNGSVLIRLSLEERIAVACYHIMPSGQSNWVVDTDTGHSVCFSCGKPAPAVVLRICPTCDNQFVLPLNHKRWEPKFFVAKDNSVHETHIECDGCY